MIFIGMKKARTHRSGSGLLSRQCSRRVRRRRICTIPMPVKPINSNAPPRIAIHAGDAGAPVYAKPTFCVLLGVVVRATGIATADVVDGVTTVSDVDGAGVVVFVFVGLVELELGLVGDVDTVVLVVVVGGAQANEYVCLS